MAATLAMSGGGQEDPFSLLQKETLPLGFLLEDSVLFGLDCKVTEKSVHNDYAQVTRQKSHIHDGFEEWAWQFYYKADFDILFDCAQTSTRPMLFSPCCLPPLSAGLSEQLDAEPSRSVCIRRMFSVSASWPPVVVCAAPHHTRLTTDSNWGQNGPNYSSPWFESAAAACGGEQLVDQEPRNSPSPACCCCCCS